MIMIIVDGGLGADELVSQLELLAKLNLLLHKLYLRHDTPFHIKVHDFCISTTVRFVQQIETH